MSFCVYRLTNTLNGKKYIGKATELRSRVRRHWSYSRRGSNTPLHCAMRKYGETVFTLERIADFASEAEAFAFERAAIIAEGTRVPVGYNVTAGGEGATGYAQTEETKQKKSAALKGRKPTEATIAAGRVANTGRIHTPETRARMSAASKGRPKSEQTKLRMSAAATGKKKRPLTQEWREKVGAATRGKPRNRDAVERTAATNRGRVRGEQARANMRAGWTVEARERASMSAKARWAARGTHNDGDTGLQRVSGGRDGIPADAVDREHSSIR